VVAFIVLSTVDSADPVMLDTISSSASPGSSGPTLRDRRRAAQEQLRQSARAGAARPARIRMDGQLLTGIPCCELHHRPQT
jgi:hypothetical protein